MAAAACFALEDDVVVVMAAVTSTTGICVRGFGLLVVGGGTCLCRISMRSSRTGDGERARGGVRGRGGSGARSKPC